MRKVNNNDNKEHPNADISSDNDKELHDLTDKDLEKISGGVPGYWDYDDPTTHS